MPFNHHPQPNIRDWKPDYDSFDQETERLLVYTDWDDRIILAWSSDERSTGSHIIAPEAIPENLRSYFGEMLAPYEYKPGEFVQSKLFVYQQDNNSLKIDLAHPVYSGSFDTSGHVCRVYRVQRGQRRHSLEVAGHRRPITKRELRVP